MSDTQRLLAEIKRLLKARGLRYADVAVALGLSEATVKRQLSRGPLDLQQLERLCALLEVDFFELARGARDRAQAGTQLSLAQENALAAEPRLLVAFHLLCNGWSKAAVCEEFGLDAPQAVLLLARLDKLGLIDLLPGDRVRLRVPRAVEWRNPGPVRQRYAQLATTEFLRDGFDAEGRLLRLEVQELGAASIEALRAKLDKLAHEFNERAVIDAGLPARQRHSVGMLLGLRPWVFSLLDTLRDDASRQRRPKLRRG